MKILVTGGSGFLGRSVIYNLLKKKYFVINYDLNDLDINHKNYKFFKGDILDYMSLKKAIKAVDYIYHYAGFADIDDSTEKPKDVAEQNIIGLINILQLSKINKVKRVFIASSLYVYSQKGSFYRVSKQSGELFVKEFNNQFNLNYTILRYGSLYGLNSSSKNGIKRLLSQAITKKEIQYKGDPNDTREYINVDDAAEISANLLEAQYKNKTLIISGVDKFKAEELFRIFGEILNKKIKVKYQKNLDNKHYNMTPFSYSDDITKKIIPSKYIEFGEGILKLINEIKKDR